jgi:hypothetical protein
VLVAEVLAESIHAAVRLLTQTNKKLKLKAEIHPEILIRLWCKQKQKPKADVNSSLNPQNRVESNAVKEVKKIWS